MGVSLNKCYFSKCLTSAVHKQIIIQKLTLILRTLPSYRKTVSNFLFRRFQSLD